ncbi:recombinase family protein [Nocardia sp. NBC_00881]|uniref:recombinase family protein n=1 Tax=Nocardia sp. NBC_00881 TaxID=2975995 RepID=UPI003862E058|nr:recombinase family protein [Nocardia sp. NBC_00881]
MAYDILVPQRRARVTRTREEGLPPDDERGDIRPGVFGPADSARQKKDETIRSQTAALRAHAEQLGLEVPAEWVFEDEGHSGATLIRPALERLRDLVAGVGVDVVLCYSPDRLARKFAYQALLIEEFTRAGTRVEFVKGPRRDTPEDQLLVQFQGMFAEYEKAQIMERYRRGKTHRAKTGSVNVLSGAPFGYRYPRKSEATGAAYEILAHEAVWSRRCFGAMPTTAPPSPSRPAGSPNRACPPAPARAAGTAR